MTLPIAAAGGSLLRLLNRGFTGPSLEALSCETLQGFSFQQQRQVHDLTSPTVTSLGYKAGPGGRSSVSGITATVFGCTGFLGRYIVNALAKQGSQVVIPYRCDDNDMQHLRVMGDLGQVVRFKGFDLRSDDHIKSAISRSNVVINLLNLEKETPNFSFEDVHVDAAARIARHAAQNPTTELFWQGSCLAASEQSPSRRLRSLAEGERLVRQHFPDATIFKPAHMVGVEDRLFNTYAQLAKRLPLIPLIDGGRRRLQPVWVRDVADAMVSTLTSSASQGQTYHLAGPDILSTEEVVRLVYDVIRETYRVIHVPSSLAKVVAGPREWLLKRLPVPLPVPTMFTEDYIAEQAQDAVLPESGALTFADLDVQPPKKVTLGVPIEHVRHFRVGGYDLGTTSQDTTTGGAGYGT